MITERALNYKDIILKHGKCVVSSRSECDITTKIAGKTVNAPVFCSNMVSVLNHDIVKKFDDNKWFHIWHRIGDYSHIKDYVKWANESNLYFVSISIGIKQQDIELLTWINDSGYRVDSICIDVAFSYNDVILPIVESVKKLFPTTYLIVGNGDSPEWVEWLERYGVDCAKFGIGVSKACRTRQFTGFGSTTVTDLVECAKVSNNIQILADGGLTVENDEVWIGDIAKAIHLGADFVMSGTLFKNCIDSPALTNSYYGNASRKAKGNNHVEGTILDNIQTNGLTTIELISLIEESIQSSVSYCGGKTLIDLIKCDYQIVN